MACVCSHATISEVTHRNHTTRRQLDRALPSDAEVVAKRPIYDAAEPRDLAYNVSRDLIERAYAGEGRFSRGDGVAILLMSWNSGFYRFRPDLGRQLAPALEELIEEHDASLASWRERSAATYDPAVDATEVEQVYRAFVRVLWPVGTAKSLHVLAPGFFPIWDQWIARAFRLRLSPPETSVASYLTFMDIAREFARGSRLTDPLKALDEWAYVTYTLRR
jgi:hypothetical protein